MALTRADPRTGRGTLGFQRLGQMARGSGMGRRPVQRHRHLLERENESDIEDDIRTIGRWGCPVGEVWTDYSLPLQASPKPSTGLGLEQGRGFDSPSPHPSDVESELMAGELRGRFIRFVPSPEGRQADVALVEPNGDEHVVRCLIGVDGTDIGGNRDELVYLNERYGDQTVCLAARSAVLGR